MVSRMARAVRRLMPSPNPRGCVTGFEAVLNGSSSSWPLVCVRRDPAQPRCAACESPFWVNRVEVH
jgi:hypothetical protein